MRSLESRPKVLLVSHAFSPEGPRRQIDELGKMVEVRVVAPPIWETIPWPTTNRDSPDGSVVTYRRISLVGFQYLLLTATMGIRKFKPDLVHIDYDPWSAIYWQARIVVALFAKGTPVISSAKKNTFRRHSGIAGALKRWLANLGIRSTNRIEAASEMTARMYEREFGVSPDRISVMTHMGVDTDRFTPTSRSTSTSEPVVVGFCGQYSEHKGVDVLVEAVRRAREGGANIELDLLGDGPLRSELKAQEQTFGWLTVRRPVHHDDVPDFMRGLDIYVLPAAVLPDHEEHDAHAMLQAMASGVPVIGTISGIIPEILSQDLGVLVNPSSPGELAEAIIGLDGNPARRKELSAAGVARIEEKYSLAAVAARRSAEYSQVLGSD